MRSRNSRSNSVPTVDVAQMIAHGGATSIQHSIAANAGAISDVAAQTADSVDNLTFILDHSAGNAGDDDMNFMIGDADGMIALAAGGVYVKPTSTSQFNATIVEKIMARAALVVGFINVTTTVGAAQFAKPLLVHKADLSGGYSRKVISFGGLTRNNQQNQLTQSVRLPKKSRFGINYQRSCSLAVVAGEKVSLNLGFVAAQNRQIG